MLKYNLFGGQRVAITGVGDFPIKKGSDISIEAFAIQCQLNQIVPAFKLVEDGKVGPKTFAALAALNKGGGYWTGIYPTPDQIDQIAFDKLMKPKNFKQKAVKPTKFGKDELFQCNKMLKDSAVMIADSMTRFEQNAPKSKQIKSAFAAKYMADISSLIEKYNKYANNMNALYESKGFFSSAPKYWDEFDAETKAYVTPRKGTLTLLACGDYNVNSIKKPYTAEKQADFYEVCVEIMEAAYILVSFAQKYYTLATASNNGTPDNKSGNNIPPILDNGGGGTPTTDSDPIDQVVKVVGVFMSLLPIAMIFVGIKVVANVVNGIDKHSKF